MRLIDANAINFRLSKDATPYLTVCDIENAPTIDPVHAAGGCYCRECNFWDSDGRCEPLKNGLIIEFTEPNDFCSYGERKEGH